jgi:hypothetical protein
MDPGAVRISLEMHVLVGIRPLPEQASLIYAEHGAAEIELGRDSRRGKTMNLTLKY